MSPFRMTAASAVSSLKNITALSSGGTGPAAMILPQAVSAVASAAKRRKLSLPPAPDSDLKAAASALTGLAATVAPPRAAPAVRFAADAASAAAAATKTTAAIPPASNSAQQDRSPLMPRNVNGTSSTATAPTKTQAAPPVPKVSNALALRALPSQPSALEKAAAAQRAALQGGKPPRKARAPPPSSKLQVRAPSKLPPVPKPPPTQAVKPPPTQAVKPPPAAASYPQASSLPSAAASHPPYHPHHAPSHQPPPIQPSSKVAAHPKPPSDPRSAATTTAPHHTPAWTWPSAPHHLWARAYHHRPHHRRRYHHHYHTRPAAATATATSRGGSTFPLNYYSVPQGKPAQQPPSTIQEATPYLSGVHHPSFSNVSALTAISASTAATIAATVANYAAPVAAAATTEGQGGGTFPVNYYAVAPGNPVQQLHSTSQMAETMMGSLDRPSFSNSSAVTAASTATAAASVATTGANSGDREWTVEDDRRLALLVSDYKKRCRGASTAAERYDPKDDREWTADDDLRLKQLVSEYQQMNSLAPAPAAGNKRKFQSLSEPTPIMLPAPVKTTPDAPEPEKTFEVSVDDSKTVLPAEDGGITNEAKVIRRKRNTWTEEEDKELDRVVQDLKAKTNKVCWSTVMRMMPGRDSKQCRDRYLNHLDPKAVLNKSVWTEEEDRKLLNFIKKHGTRWRLMQATILRNRTELTIKNRWNSAMKRRYTRFLSKRWGVSEESIKLLTSRGLLNPGVDIDQILRVARCKMIDAAYNVGEVESSRELVVSDAPSEAADPAVQDDIANVLFKYEGSADVSRTVQLRIFKGNMADDESALTPLGLLETCGVNSFAYLRAFLTTKFQCLSGLDFRFSVNHLGILSVKQEIDLGPVGAVLKALATGEGTEASPYDLLVVD